jgi:transaldolase
MKATEKLHEMGQSLGLDNITRGLLTSGTLRRYIRDFSITGLTSNPTIFDHAIKNSHDYDDAIRQKLKEGKSGEALFFELALEDLRQAADLFRPIHDQTNGMDGWVSLEVSPLLAHDTAGTLAAAKELHARAGRPNLFVKIPGTKEGLPAIEEAIFAGVPINVTLLFSRAQYVAAAAAYRRGIERRIAAGLNPAVGSVASMFISRWDVAVRTKAPEALRDQLGIAVAGQTYEAYRSMVDSPPLAAHPQRWSPPPASALGQHRDQGPGRLGHLVRPLARLALYRKHDARGHVESPRRSSGHRPDVAHACPLLRPGAGQIRQGRH